MKKKPSEKRSKLFGRPDALLVEESVVPGTSAPPPILLDPDRAAERRRPRPPEPPPLQIQVVGPTVDDPDGAPEDEVLAAGDAEEDGDGAEMEGAFIADAAAVLAADEQATLVDDAAARAPKARGGASLRLRPRVIAPVKAGAPDNEDFLGGLVETVRPRAVVEQGEEPGVELHFDAGVLDEGYDESSVFNAPPSARMPIPPPPAVEMPIPDDLPGLRAGGSTTAPATAPPRRIEPLLRAPDDISESPFDPDSVPARPAPGFPRPRVPERRPERFVERPAEPFPEGPSPLVAERYSERHAERHAERIEPEERPPHRTPERALPRYAEPADPARALAPSPTAYERAGERVSVRPAARPAPTPPRAPSGLPISPRPPTQEPAEPRRAEANVRPVNQGGDGVAMMTFGIFVGLMVAGGALWLYPRMFPGAPKVADVAPDAATAAPPAEAATAAAPPEGAVTPPPGEATAASSPPAETTPSTTAPPATTSTTVAAAPTEPAASPVKTTSKATTERTSPPPAQVGKVAAGDPVTVENGYLRVASDKKCLVIVDGRQRGYAPDLGLIELPPGEHTLKCVVPGAGTSRSMTVRVDSGALRGVDLRFTE